MPTKESRPASTAIGRASARHAHGGSCAAPIDQGSKGLDTQALAELGYSDVSALLARLDDDRVPLALMIDLVNPARGADDLVD